MVNKHPIVFIHEDIIVTDEQDNNIGSMFSWFDTLKIMGLCTIGFILFLISIRLFIACKILTKISKVKHSINSKSNIEFKLYKKPQQTGPYSRIRRNVECKTRICV